MTELGELLDTFFKGYRSRRGGTKYHVSALKPAKEYFSDMHPSQIDTQTIDQYLLSRKGFINFTSD